MLEASASGVKEGTWIGEGTVIRATLDSTRGAVLVEAQSCGIELLGDNGSIDYVDARHLLGEALECCAKTVHSSM